MMIALTVVNYGFPIAQLATLKETSVPVVRDREGSDGRAARSVRAAATCCGA